MSESQCIPAKTLAKEMIAAIAKKTMAKCISRKSRINAAAKKNDAWADGKDGFLGTGIKTFVWMSVDGLCLFQKKYMACAKTNLETRAASNGNKNIEGLFFKKDIAISKIPAAKGKYLAQKMAAASSCFHFPA